MWGRQEIAICPGASSGGTGGGWGSSLCVGVPVWQGVAGSLVLGGAGGMIGR
ncbi:MAG: hypothetical protein QM784_34380 [Polyangiaceae bacterium]